MLRRFLRKEKPRVFLGVLAVVQRTDLKRHLEEEGILESESLDGALRRSLVEIFHCRPRSPSRLRFQPFVRADMELLLCQACVKLLADMQKAI